MMNWKTCGALPLMLGLLLLGCAGKPGGLPLSSLPAMPELPASARQGQTPPQCSPTCLEKWKQQAEQWQVRLTDPVQQGLPVSGSMTD